MPGRAWAQAGCLLIRCRNAGHVRICPSWPQQGDPKRHDPVRPACYTQMVGSRPLLSRRPRRRLACTVTSPIRSHHPSVLKRRQEGRVCPSKESLARNKCIPPLTRSRLDTTDTPHMSSRFLLGQRPHVRISLRSQCQMRIEVHECCDSHKVGEPAQVSVSRPSHWGGPRL